MREDLWSFAPSHTFVMLTNNKPLIGGTEQPGTLTGFVLALRNRGFDAYTAHGRKRWRSLALVEDDPRG